MIDLNNNKWFRTSDLNQGRENHSSCCIGELIFVICGEESFKKLNSIEKLDFGYSSSRTWEKIELEQLTPRYCLVVCAISDKEILIMGGHDGESYLNDVHVYQHKTKTIEKKSPSPLAFMSRGNVVKLQEGMC